MESNTQRQKDALDNIWRGGVNMMIAHATAVNMAHSSLEKARYRKPETVYVDCTLCNENKPGTVKDGIAICDDCHMQEVGE